MAPISVVVNGALGRMGQQVLSAVSGEEDMLGRGRRGPRCRRRQRLDSRQELCRCRSTSSLPDVLDGVDVVVDFSNAEGASGVIRDATPRKGQRRRRLHWNTGGLGSRKPQHLPTSTASASSSPPTSRWERLL